MAKTFRNIAAQGDFVIVRVNEIPADLEAVQPEGNVYVLAHSETGHNHVIEMDRVKVFKPKGVKENDLYELFMVVESDSTIEHLRTHDTHEALTVPAGNFKIFRQREYTPLGFRKAAD